MDSVPQPQGQLHDTHQKVGAHLQCKSASPRPQQQGAGAYAGGMRSAGPGLTGASSPRGAVLVSAATGEEALGAGKSLPWAGGNARLSALILTLGHKEHLDHLEGNLDRPHTGGP